MTSKKIKAAAGICLVMVAGGIAAACGVVLYNATHRSEKSGADDDGVVRPELLFPGHDVYVPYGFLAKVNRSSLRLDRIFDLPSYLANGKAAIAGDGAAAARELALNAVHNAKDWVERSRFLADPGAYAVVFKWLLDGQTLLLAVGAGKAGGTFYYDAGTVALSL